MRTIHRHRVLPVHNHIVGWGNPQLVEHCLPNILDKVLGKTGVRVLVDCPAAGRKLVSGQRRCNNAAIELNQGCGVGVPGCTYEAAAFILAGVVVCGGSLGETLHRQ